MSLWLAAWVLVITLMLSALSHAKTNNWDVEGEHGVLNLHILGALSEEACRLDMASAYQEIDLGVTSNSRLHKVGGQGTPIAFSLRFRDCLRTAGAIEDPRGGNLFWSAHQPLVSVTFVGPADADNPQLLKVDGVTGMGLRLVDPLQRDIRLGSRGAPLFLTPGHDQLTWYVRPERTTAPLTAGAYRAMVDFQLSYD